MRELISKFQVQCQQNIFLGSSDHSSKAIWVCNNSNAMRMDQQKEDTSLKKIP
jgi:hypothetical protein